MGLLLLWLMRLLPEGVMSWTGRRTTSSDGWSDGGGGGWVLMVLMSSSDWLGYTETCDRLVNCSPLNIRSSEYHNNSSCDLLNFFQSRHLDMFWAVKNISSPI